jgi:hypothetical protein
MSSSENIVTAPGLAVRAKNILMAPKAEWERIDSETTSTGALYAGYVAILAAIGPICSAVGAILFGYGAFGVSIRPSIGSVLTSSVVTYILSLVSVFVLGLIIDALAPRFGGQKSSSQALKLAAYSSTAPWVVGVFGLLPMMSPLSIIGLYSVYLLYLGLPRLMKAPADKALPYTAVVIVAGIVLAIVVGMVVTPLRMIGGGGSPMAGSDGTVNGTVKIGGTSVDLGKLQAASKQAQAQADAIKSGAPAPAGLSQDALKGLLPASINGFARGDISAESATGGGVGVTHAEASYTRGTSRITVEITDLSAMGGAAAMAGAMSVSSSKETATGYEKIGTVNGRMTTEEYDRSDKSGKFGVLAASHVMVEARGSGVTIDDLKAAVAAVGPEKIEALSGK